MPHSPATILVAEDDPVQRQLYADLLTQVGYTVWQASDGSTTLDLVREKRPDLAILDITMPGMSGWNVLRQIRDDYSLGTVLVIVVTGLTDTWDRDASIAAGADAHLTKPLRPELLLAEIKRILGR